MERLAPDGAIPTMNDDDVVLTDDDRAKARAESGTIARNATLGGIGLVAVVYAATAALLLAAWPGASALELSGVGAAVAIALPTPLLGALAHGAQRMQLETTTTRIAHDRLMRDDAHRREFDTRLARGFEMVQDETGAFDVVHRALRRVLPDAAAELLVADNSHAHLERVVVAAPEGAETPGCAVDSPDQCEAARRAQTQVFPDSENLDACPMLRDRAVGQCSGICVPVSIMGRTVGVLHAIGAVGEPVDDPSIQALQTLATQSGNRLGMLRVMAETQLQASTDGLTGLTNRRSFENQLRSRRSSGESFAFVMADLDRFKLLNDTHGHEAGDRALRVFAEALRRELRTEDLVCRYGGEEFAIALPAAAISEAVEAMGRVREALVQLSSRGDAPGFTASFGVSHSSEAADLDDLVQRADAALFAAKDAGRDGICLDGHDVPIAPRLTALS